MSFKSIRFVFTTLAAMALISQIKRNKEFIQHGTTSIYDHCRNVALVSLKIADSFKIKVDRDSLVKGALLHDYYLYDWHTHKFNWHGFTHPKIALENARKEFNLTSVEEDIISRHMFPLTPLPPKTKEGAVVCIADKLCSLYETFRLNERRRPCRV